jgi:hypothetical protein
MRSDFLCTASSPTHSILDTALARISLLPGVLVRALFVLWCIDGMKRQGRLELLLMLAFIALLMVGSPQPLQICLIQVMDSVWLALLKSWGSTSGMKADHSGAGEDEREDLSEILSCFRCLDTPVITKQPNGDERPFGGCKVSVDYT